MKHFSAGEVEFMHGDSGPRYLCRGPEIEWGELVLKPGQGSRDYGRHYHAVVEETFFILAGQARVWIDGQEFMAATGDVIRVDPGEKHWLQNDGSENLHAVFMKHPFQPGDRHEF